MSPPTEPSRVKGLPPKSPAALQSPIFLLRRPSSGVWAPVREKLQRAPGGGGGLIRARSRSRSNSDVESSSAYADAKTVSSRAGGESTTQGRHVGTGGGGGLEDGDGHTSYSGRYGYALRRCAGCNERDVYVQFIEHRAVQFIVCVSDGQGPCDLLLCAGNTESVCSCAHRILILPLLDTERRQYVGTPTTHMFGMVFASPPCQWFVHIITLQHREQTERSAPKVFATLLMEWDTFAKQQHRAATASTDRQCSFVLQRYR